MQSESGLSSLRTSEAGTKRQVLTTTGMLSTESVQLFRSLGFCSSGPTKPQDTKMSQNDLTAKPLLWSPGT